MSADRELGPRRVATGDRAVLITGGAGFIGTNLASRLLARGRPVVILDNLSRPGVRANLDWLTDTYAGRFRLVVGDVRDPAALARALDGVGHVFHLAAQVAVTTSLERPVEDFDVNARGTLALLEAVRTRGTISLLYTSTNKVYGSLEDIALEQRAHRYRPVDPRLRAKGIAEDRPLACRSPYGCSKGTADQYVLDYAHSYGLRTVVFRMSCIYGPHQHGTEDQGWVAHFVRAALEGRPLTLYGDGCQVRDLLFVDDLVEAMLLAEQRIDGLAGRAFNIGGGPAHAVSLIDVVTLLGAMLQHEIRWHLAPWRTADQRYYVTDHRRFSRATGWRPTTGVPQGLDHLLSWARRSPAVPALAASTVVG